MNELMGVIALIALVSCVCAVVLRERELRGPRYWEIAVDMRDRETCDVRINIRGKPRHDAVAWVVKDKFGPERTWVWNERLPGDLVGHRRLVEVPHEVLWVIERVRATYLRERGELPA